MTVIHQVNPGKEHVIYRGNYSCRLWFMRRVSRWWSDANCIIDGWVGDTWRRQRVMWQTVNVAQLLKGLCHEIHRHHEPTFHCVENRMKKTSTASGSAPRLHNFSSLRWKRDAARRSIRKVNGSFQGGENDIENQMWIRECKGKIEKVKWKVKDYSIGIMLSRYPLKLTR